MNKVIPIVVDKRGCDGCTRCCEGWLYGSAHGHNFWTGRPCHYLGEKKCSIYTKRPTDPCKTYECMWLKDKTMPEWMKPSISNVILTARKINDIEFIEVLETGKTISSLVLNWIFTQYAAGVFKNVKYQIEGGWNYMGTTEFIKLMTEGVTNGTK